MAISLTKKEEEQQQIQKFDWFTKVYQIVQSEPTASCDVVLKKVPLQNEWSTQHNTYTGKVWRRCLYFWVKKKWDSATMGCNWIHIIYKGGLGPRKTMSGVKRLNSHHECFSKSDLFTNLSTLSATKIDETLVYTNILRQ